MLLIKDTIKSIPIFFIIGRPRSGTTLLKTLFDAHPNVIIPPESPIILRLHGKYSKIKYWTGERLLDFYNDLLEVKNIEIWKYDSEKLKNDILSCEGDFKFSDLCKIMLINNISAFKKKEINIIGDKNPAYSIWIKKIFKLYPDAKYIHLTRDYRDHILSMIRVQLLIPFVFFIAARWKFSAKQIMKLKQKNPESFYIIKYEDLVCDPGSHIKNICNFLGIPYDPNILDYQTNMKEAIKDYPEDEIKRFHENLFQPINSDRVNIWQTEMKEKNIKLADAFVGKYAELSGYSRKYKNPGFFYYIKIFPGLAFMYLYYKLYELIVLLPYSIRRYVWRYIIKPMYLVFILFLKMFSHKKIIPFNNKPYTRNQ